MMKYKDPFMGEIELTKVGETSKHLGGESRVDTIYTDSRHNYYIQTWSTLGGDPIPMAFLRKEAAELIAHVESRLNSIGSSTEISKPKSPNGPRLVTEGTIGDCPQCKSTQLKKLVSRKILGCINPNCENYHKNQNIN